MSRPKIARRIFPVQRLVGLRCWWFGCSPHYECSYNDGDATPCKHCGAPDVSYSDMVSDTRHQRLKAALHWHCYRRWWPARCVDCGHRFGGHEQCDTIPF